MKKFRYLPIVAALGLASLTSCEKYFDDVNVDPTRPKEVTPTVLLPSAMVEYGYGLQGDISRFTSLLTNQIYGADRQFATYQVYSITETDTDNWWKFNHYGGAMMDIKTLIDYAMASEQYHYAGIGKVLMAYGLMTATDLVGDVPYVEAFQGLDNLTPKYESQQVIYDSIQSLLAQGKVLLADPNVAVSEPGSDDLVYGGDLTKWAMFANVLSARAHLHLGKTDPNHYAMAIAALGAPGVESFGSSGDDAVFFFGTDYTASAPWFQYNDQRADILFEGFLLDTMTALNDPRMVSYWDADGWLGEYFTRPDAPFFFTSFMEQNFILAEAQFQAGNPGLALTAYNDAVNASLSRHGVVADSAFTANVLSETSGSLTLEKIMVQKYIAMYLEPEVFSDWRRTGFPNLVPSAGNVTGDVIPRRLPYPQSERLFNGANCNCASQNITSKVWWDM
ncbi:MAG: SusD/RagB family nutrient-binding outer membrane lipoprotein [Bacteroidia bacterium]